MRDTWMSPPSQRPDEGGEAEIPAADRVRITLQALQRGIVPLPSLQALEATQLLRGNSGASPPPM